MLWITSRIIDNPPVNLKFVERVSRIHVDVKGGINYMITFFFANDRPVHWFFEDAKNCEEAYTDIYQTIALAEVRSILNGKK
jgi:hypothetical protein